MESSVWLRRSRVFWLEEQILNKCVHRLAGPCLGPHSESGRGQRWARSLQRAHLEGGHLLAALLLPWPHRAQCHHCRQAYVCNSPHCHGLVLGPPVSRKVVFREKVIWTSPKVSHLTCIRSTVSRKHAPWVLRFSELFCASRGGRGKGSMLFLVKSLTCCWLHTKMSGSSSYDKNLLWFAEP